MDFFLSKDGITTFFTLKLYSENALVVAQVEDALTITFVRTHTKSYAPIKQAYSIETARVPTRLA